MIHGYIEKIRLVNIQSWRDATIDLDIGLNIIDADNETGKSVIMKAFRKICFYNFFGRGSNKTIIRRGTDHGECFISMVYLDGNTVIDRKVVKLEIYKTYQIYRLYTLGSIDGKKQWVLNNSWKQDTPPEEILTALGWFIDEDNNILLNLIDLEQPLPLISSDKKFNAKILKFVTENNDLKNCTENLELNLDIVKELLKVERNNHNRLSSIKSTINVKDTFKFKRNIEDREILSKKVNVLQDLFSNSLELSINLNRHKIIFKLLDENSIDNKLLILDKLNKLLLNINDFENINKFKVIDRFNESNLTIIDSIINNLNTLEETLTNVKDLTKVFKDKEILTSRLNDINKRIKDYEIENKICPLCGNEFK